MVDVAEVLNAVGVPWPDADTDKARQAGQAWKTLGTSAQAALDQGNNAANVLCANNTGQAMAAFSQYWDEFGGSGKNANLEVLVGCCNAMSDACDKFADAVDKAKSDLEEKAAEIGAAIGGGIVLTIFTAGFSDAAAGGVVAAIVPEAVATVELLGTTIGSVLASAISLTTMAALDAAVEQVAKNIGQLAAGEKVTAPSWSELGQAVAVGTLGGLIGSAVSTAVGSGSAATVGGLSDDLGTVTTQLPGILKTIPDALNTPAGKALLDIASKTSAQNVANAADNKSLEAPSAKEVIGDMLDTKIEAAAGSDD